MIASEAAARRREKTAALLNSLQKITSFFPLASRAKETAVAPPAEKPTCIDPNPDDEELSLIDASASSNAPSERPVSPPDSVPSLSSSPSARPPPAPTRKRPVSPGSLDYEKRMKLLKRRRKKPHDGEELTKEEVENYEREREKVWCGFEASLLKQLGSYEEFQILKTKLYYSDHKACSSLWCKGKIRKRSEFHRDGSVEDGLKGVCYECDFNRNLINELNSERYQVVQQRIADRPIKQSNGDTETQIIESILLPLMNMNMQTIHMPEFTNADVCASHPTWSDEPDKNLGIQVKTSGEFNSDGVEQPDDRSAGGGRAQFHDCQGYDGKVMLFLKVRRTAQGARHVTLWACDYAAIKPFVKNKVDKNGKPVPDLSLAESVDGVLNPKGVKLKYLLDFTIDPSPTDSNDFPITDEKHREHSDKLFQELTKMVKREKSTLRLVSYKTLRWELANNSQKKEAVLMLAYSAIVGRDKFWIPTGNQSSVDYCITKDGYDMEGQAKTIAFFCNHIRVDCRHRDKGVPKQPYSAGSFQELLAGRIVKSKNDQGKFQYFLVYILFDRDQLLKHGILQTEDNPEPNTCITLSRGDLNGWFPGADPVNGMGKSTQWSRNRRLKVVQLRPSTLDDGRAEALLSEAAGDPIRPMSKAPQRVRDAEIVDV